MAPARPLSDCPSDSVLESRAVKELRVPKQRAEVEVILPGRGSHRVAVFLADFAPNHAGGERLSDLLNGAGGFFPAVDAETDQVVFLNRDTIAVARIAAAFERDPASELTLPTEHEVSIRLSDGQQIEGLISFVMPPERSRLMDFLNESPPFFRLLQKDCVSLVNKHHVASIATARK